MGQQTLRGGDASPRLCAGGADLRLLAWAWGLTLWVCSAAALAAPQAPSGASGGVPTEVQERGSAIYQHGVLNNGAALQGERATGGVLRGQAAACATCHRNSGLGSSEGRVVVPPITAKYLFQAHSTNVVDIRQPNPTGVRVTRPPYDRESWARAVRNGIAPDGRALSVLMPRYALDDADLSALLNYVSALGAQLVPGVSDDTLHFATIITPDTNPVQRKAMLDVMERFFADKNAFLRGGQRPMVANRGVQYRVTRRWQLHVWELQGDAQDWEQQLRQRQITDPVFAVISGLGGANWQPVHRFCQRMKLPCLFPNVDAPVDAEGDFYNVYFSRGVLLEAALMADAMALGLAGSPGRALSVDDGSVDVRSADERSADGGRDRVGTSVVQVLRRGSAGEAAAQALEQHLHAPFATWGGPLRRRWVSPDLPREAALAQALQGLRADDVVVLWLDDADLRAMPRTPPTQHVFASGLMAGLERAQLPAAWRARVHMTYPVDLPEQRKVRMNFPLAWFRIHQLPLVDERLQTDTYVACGILAETLTEMLDSFDQDYLIERLESMLSHRQVNGYYPRLSLGPGQRFASKGGYVVRLGDAPAQESGEHGRGAGAVAETDWLVP